MTDLPKLSRREWDALGSLLLPPELGGKTKLGPKTGPKLRDLGLVTEFEFILDPSPGQPAWTRMRISGWQMTEWGRFIYCQWAGQFPIEDEE